MFMTGLNITVAIYHRRNNSDDRVGGASEYLSIDRTGLPARIVERGAPWILKAQGIVLETMYSCTVQSENYIQLQVTHDDVIIPESGQYQGIQFYVMDVQDTTLDDNPVDYRGFHRLLTLKKLLPNLVVI